MTWAVVFSGQGMQHPAMLPWLEDDDELLTATASRLCVHDWRKSLADPVWARENRNAQSLLSATSIAAWKQLQQTLPTPIAVAGYSVGEIAAYTVAGVMTPSNALNLADVRSQVMDECVRDQKGALIGVLGLTLETIEDVCKRAGVHIAIHNGPDSFVLGGTEDRIQAGQDVLVGWGAKCTRLNVSVASHTPMMEKASLVVRSWLTTLNLEKPGVTLFSNFTGTRVKSAPQACVALSGQISHTVRWSDCMDAIHDRAPSCLLEIGPGQSLAAMWNKRYADIPARSADEFRSTTAIARWICSHQA